MMQPYHSLINPFFTDDSQCVKEDFWKVEKIKKRRHPEVIRIGKQGEKATTPLDEDSCSDQVKKTKAE